MADDRLDPEIEKAMRDALDQAEQDVRKDGVTSMAAYMRQTYEAYRVAGWGRPQAFFFTVLLYRALLGR